MLTHGVAGLLEDMADMESAGFSSYWVAQVGLVDALGVIGAYGNAAHTGGTAGAEPETVTFTSGTVTVSANVAPTPSADRSPMELGTAVISTWERNPHSLATQALTAQALVGERLIVGIGVNHQPQVEGSLKQQWVKPVRHMREYLDILGDLLETGSSARDGETWSFHGDAVKPSDGTPKIMIAALGPQMLKLAGSRTDGTILWCVGHKTVATQIAPMINDAAAQAGRAAPAIVCSIPVWVTDDPQPARDFLAVILSDYATLPSYRAVMDIEGVEGLGDLSIVGSEDQVREAIGLLKASGVTDFTPVPMGGNPDEQSHTMAVLGEFLS